MVFGVANINVNPPLWPFMPGTLDTIFLRTNLRSSTRMNLSSAEVFAKLVISESEEAP